MNKTTLKSLLLIVVITMLSAQRASGFHFKSIFGDHSLVNENEVANDDNDFVSKPLDKISYFKQAAKNISEASFIKFLNFFNKTVSPDSIEFKRKFALFKDRAKLVLKSQIDYLKKRSTYKLTINEFLIDPPMSDGLLRDNLTSFLGEESKFFIKNIKNTRKILRDKDDDEDDFIKEGVLKKLAKKLFAWLLPNNQPVGNVPPEVDWLQSGCVLEPRNQGQCASCYAFAALSVLETMRCLRNEDDDAVPPRRLSVQQIVDCGPSFAPQHIFGCQGSSQVPYFFMYLKSGARIAYGAKCYKYKASSNSTCQLDSMAEDCVTKTLPNFDIYHLKDGEEMRQHLSDHGPIFAIMRLEERFELYAGGIYMSATQRNASSNQTMHSVAVYGYGQNEQGIKYYIIKNSWGTGWGEKGFAKVHSKLLEAVPAFGIVL